MSVRLYVTKYFPDRLYGFLVQGDGSEVFFHVGDFEAGALDAPPPVVGEEVEALITASESLDRAPRAQQVKRVRCPVMLRGVVDTFHEGKGWGFAVADDGESYYLHRSEVLAGKLPMAGQRVRFYGGFKRGRPRACYVTVEDDK